MPSSPAFHIHVDADLLSKQPQLKRFSHELALKYAHNELVTDDMLKAIGQALWLALDCDSDFQQARQQAGMNTLPIIINSDQAAIQQLPWETLHHPEYGFLGKHKGFALSCQLAQPTRPTSNPEKGPLRVLLFTSMTEDQQRLDVEQEQEQVLEALLPWINDGKVQLEMPNDGRFSTFERCLEQQPHLVFLSGHGKFYDKKFDPTLEHDYATFAFEAEQDMGSHEVKAEQLS